MSFVHVLADQTSIYATTADGAMLWYADLLRNGQNGPTAQTGWAAGSGNTIGTGWTGFRHVFAGGSGIIYVVTDDGRLLWYADMARTGQSNWHSNSGRQIGVGWGDFTHIFADGTGVIYAIRPTGELLWYRDELRDGTNGEHAERGWAAGSGSQIGFGWDFRWVFSGGGGVIYAISSDGALRWYRDDVRNGTNGNHAERGWATGSGNQIGLGWQGFTKVFGSLAEDGTIYAVTDTTDLLWYGDQLRNGSNGAHAERGWAPGSGNPIGIGWSVQPNEVLLHAYCKPLSVSPDHAIALKLRAGLPTDCSVSVHRLRENADRTVGIQVAGPFPASAAAFAGGIDQWQNGCGWEDALTIQAEADWPSGLYSLRCEAAGYKTADAVFVLRPGANRKRFLMLANTNCWNAYNAWGGRSNYSGAGVVTLSFERPNFEAAPSSATEDGYVANHLTAAEIWVLTWLEDNGYAFDVCSDLDFHNGDPDCSTYDAVILSTHPEYWSQTMAARLRGYLANGGNLLYLGGNGIFRQVEFSADGSAMTTGDSPDWFCGNAWAGGPKPRTLLGVAYDIGHDGLYPTRCGYVIEAANHRFFAGTGLMNGDVIGALGRNGGGACGWEVDCAIDFGEGNGPAPANLIILARGENVTGAGYTGHMTYYDTAGGGFVFSIGSITLGGSLVVDSALQMILRNALDACVR
jgi:N,N-dimethylformamidase